MNYHKQGSAKMGADLQASTFGILLISCNKFEHSRLSNSSGSASP